MTNINSRYLVTGSSGFLGFHFVKFLAGKKINTIGTYNLHAPQINSRNKHISFIKCDLLNPKEVQNLPKTDIVVHFAATVSGTNKIYTNTLLTKNIVDLCNTNKSRLIFISSSQVLYPIKNSYIASKRKNEDFIKKNCKNFTIVRPSAPYGHEIKQFKQGRKQPLHVLSHATKLPLIPVIGNGNNTRQPLHIDDLNEFILQLCRTSKANHKIYNIGGPDLLTYNEMINKILKVKKRNSVKIHIPVSVARVLAQFVSFTDPENITASTIDENINDNWEDDFSLHLKPFRVGCKDLP